MPEFLKKKNHRQNWVSATHYSKATELWPLTQHMSSLQINIHNVLKSSYLREWMFNLTNQETNLTSASSAQQEDTVVKRGCQEVRTHILVSGVIHVSLGCQQLIISWDFKFIKHHINHMKNHEIHGYKRKLSDIGKKRRSF